MKLLALALCVACASAANATAHPVVGGYFLFNGKNNKQLDDLANNAATIPINRLWVAFFSPEMMYKAGSKTLADTGLNMSSAADAGFAELKSAVTRLEAGGVEVFLSMGGWNYNCFPYAYMKYSIGAYNPSPNYWKIEKYGGGSTDGCNEGNQFCYTCEPPSEHADVDHSYTVFPEPDHSATWKQAQQFIQTHAGGQAPEWHPEIAPGAQWTDSQGSKTVRVPGEGTYKKRGTDPYADIVTLASELGASGIDLDYEEFWHGDYFKTSTGTATTGPWELNQTAYKYAAIAKDMMINIENIDPKLKLSTASAAVGAWGGKWWGGNLKGLWLKVNQWYPSIIKFMSTGKNAGGINVMTYDLSDDTVFHECPNPSTCNLESQVAYFMATYDAANIQANVGYEIGTPAYPGENDKQHRMPLTKANFQSILSTTQPNHGGFFWQLYKPTVGDDEDDFQDVAQRVCHAVLGDDKRCSGTFPGAAPAPTGDTYKCKAGQCVKEAGGGSKSACEEICG